MMDADDESQGLLPIEPPDVPVVYVDWNVAQYLAEPQPLFDELLLAIVRARVSRAALVPYSVAHMMDATAGWTAVEHAHRAARFRSMMFLDGLCGGILWDLPADRDGQRFRRESFIDACEVRGHFSDLRTAAPELVREYDAVLKAHVESAKAEMRATAKASPHVPPELAEEMIAELDALFRDGLPDVSDAGRIFGSIMRPAFLHVMDTWPSIDDCPPGDAVQLVNARLGPAAPGLSFESMTEAVLSQQPTMHPDDYGPMMLSWLGYNRERRKDVRRGAPGIVADHTHARFAMSSAVFLTGDRRLERRCSAWAAHTCRGPLHGSWPVLLHVAPNDQATVERAARTLNAFSDRFCGLLDELTRSP